jgi:hypothetical protein
MASEYTISFFVLWHIRSRSGYRTRGKLENGEIVVTGNDWPLFLYAGESFDEGDPWNGLFRGQILITVR